MDIEGSSALTISLNSSDNRSNSENFVYGLGPPVALQPLFHSSPPQMPGQLNFDLNEPIIDTDIGAMLNLVQPEQQTGGHFSPHNAYCRR